MRALLIVWAMSLACCYQPKPLTPANPDASDATVPMPAASPCEAACAALAAAGCAEGISPVCVAVYAAIDGAKAVRKPDGHALTCADVAAVNTRAQAQALGVACP